MKKLILLSILLIVGCAPTKPSTANFYIGMTEKEFIEQNNINMVTESIVGNDVNESDKYVKINTSVFPQDSTSAIYGQASNNKLTPYYFEFQNDTLAGVYGGLINYSNGNQIDYSKYPNSKPE